MAYLFFIMNCLLMRESPLIIALNKEKTVYDGFITVMEKDLRIRISLPPDRQMKQAKLHCCWQMKRLLHGYQHIVKQRLQHSTNLMAFILELKTVLEVALKSQPGCQSFSPPQYYSQLITEIEILGWDKYDVSSASIGSHCIVFSYNYIQYKSFALLLNVVH